MLQLLDAFWTNNVRLVVKNWTRSVDWSVLKPSFSLSTYVVFDVYHVFHASQAANFFSYKLKIVNVSFLAVLYSNTFCFIVFAKARYKPQKRLALYDL